MGTGLVDDGVHRWESEREFTAKGASGYVEQFVCIDCQTRATVTRPDSQWGLGQGHWQASTKPHPCNAQVRAERLARAASFAESLLGAR